MHHALPRTGLLQGFTGNSGYNTAAPQPATETSQSQYPSQLYGITEHPSSPLEVQKEMPQQAGAPNIDEYKEIKVSSHHKVVSISFITTYTFKKNEAACTRSALHNVYILHSAVKHQCLFMVNKALVYLHTDSLTVSRIYIWKFNPMGGFKPVCTLTWIYLSKYR